MLHTCVGRGRAGGPRLRVSAPPRANSAAKSEALTSVGKERESERQRVIRWHSSSVRLAYALWKLRTAGGGAARDGSTAIELRREERNSTRATEESRWYDEEGVG